MRKGSRKTKCRRGHKLVDPNIIYREKKDGTIYWECRSCANAGMRERRKLKSKGKPGKGGKSKPAAKPKPTEEIMQEPNEQKPAAEQDTQIDPMEFLETTEAPEVVVVDAPAQADEAFGPVSVGDPESPHALTGQPTAQDLDNVAEEQAIAEQTVATEPVPAPAPVAPAPRRPGCGHGFSNARLCPTCRASGV